MQATWAADGPQCTNEQSAMTNVNEAAPNPSRVYRRERTLAAEASFGNRLLLSITGTATIQSAVPVLATGERDC